MELLCSKEKSSPLKDSIFIRVNQIIDQHSTQSLLKDSNQLVPLEQEYEIIQSIPPTIVEDEHPQHYGRHIQKTSDFIDVSDNESNSNEEMTVSNPILNEYQPE